jgi:hypothetical protein
VRFLILAASRVASFYSRASAFLFPSLYEGRFAALRRWRTDAGADFNASSLLEVLADAVS